MTEPVSKTEGSMVQWQEEGEHAILIESFSDNIVLTQQYDAIHIYKGSIDEFVRNLRQAQKAVKKMNS